MTTNCSIVDFEASLHILVLCTQTSTLFAGGCVNLVLGSALQGQVKVTIKYLGAQTAE